MTCSLVYNPPGGEINVPHHCKFVACLLHCSLLLSFSCFHIHMFLMKYIIIIQGIAFLRVFLRKHCKSMCVELWGKSDVWQQICCTGYGYMLFWLFSAYRCVNKTCLTLQKYQQSLVFFFFFMEASSPVNTFYLE